MKMQQEAQEKDRDRQKDIEIALINAEARDQANRLDIDLQKVVWTTTSREGDRLEARSIR